MLCGLCALLLRFRYVLDGPEFRYERHARQLMQGSSTCVMCKLLYDWLPGVETDDGKAGRLPFQLPHPPSDLKDCMHYGAKVAEFVKHPGCYRLRLRYFISSDLKLSPETMGVRMFVLLPVQMAERYLSQYQLDETTGSEPSLDQAEAWLTSCRSNHINCQKYDQLIASESRSSIFRPKRLIEILPSEIRLHDTSQERIYNYFALSHRWPTNPASLLRLTINNLNGFRKLIPQSTDAGFSQVFQDAIEVCRHLKIGYIWIDSLCIIQSGDGGADFRVQGSLMGEIYKHAVCTISATSVEDPDRSLQGGMFKMRENSIREPMFQHASFDLRWTTWQPQGLIQIFQKKPKPGSYYFLPEDQWHRSLSSAPLFRRGWVMQERILSPRILHFAADQIFFECYENICNETWSGGDPIFRIGKPPRNSTILQDLTLKRANFLDMENCSEAQKLLFDNPLAVWFQVAHGYAGTTLTRPQDKLIAISGLAKGIMPFLKASPSDYLAGIWVQTLPYSLLWYTSLYGRTSEPIRLDTPYQAPTWSWASLNAWAPGINSYGAHLQPHEVLITIDGFSTKPIADPFGEIEPGGYIRITGTTYAVSIVWKAGVSNVSPAPKFWPQARIGTGKLARNWGENLYPDERYIEGQSTDRTDLRMLPVLRSASGSAWKWQEMLLLEPTGQIGEYKRFGYMNVVGKNGQEWFRFLTDNVIGKTMAGKRQETMTII